MNTDALRKLANTLKPLTEIADQLDKLATAENHLAELKGAIVGAQRELEAARAKAKDVIEQADKKAKEAVVKATEESQVEAARIIAEAKQLADETRRELADDSKALEKKLHDDQARHNELKSQISELAKRKSEMDAEVKQSESKLDAIRKAVAALRV